MTRKLSPVPDTSRSGVDVAELRRNMAPGAPASLQAVQPTASRATMAADTRSPLSEPRIALHDAIAFRDRCFTRRAELLDREAIGGSRRAQLEADLERAIAAGDAPAARRAREGLEDLAVETHPLTECLRQAEADYQAACSALQRAEAAVRQAAVAAIASGFEGLLERYVETAKAAIAADHEVWALIAFLRTHGHGDWACVELARRVADARIIEPLRRRYEDEEQRARAPYIESHTARLERLLAGEEG